MPTTERRSKSVRRDCWVRSFGRARALAALLCVLILACLEPPPDLGATVAIRDEDTRLLVLLREVDQLGQSDPAGAARALRESLIPRARANALACEEIHPRHYRAQRLVRRLTALTRERAELLLEYAGALERDDTAALLSVVHRQRVLDPKITRLYERIEAAASERPARGCGRSTG